MSTFLEILLEKFTAKIPKYADHIPRDLNFSEIPSKIDVAIGMRRTGKTSLLF